MTSMPKMVLLSIFRSLSTYPLMLLQSCSNMSLRWVFLLCIKWFTSFHLLCSLLINTITTKIKHIDITNITIINLIYPTYISSSLVITSNYSPIWCWITKWTSIIISDIILITLIILSLIRLIRKMITIVVMIHTILHGCSLFSSLHIFSILKFLLPCTSLFCSFSLSIFHKYPNTSSMV